jgi:hypothetical protein
MNPSKIKIQVKICVKNQQMQQIFIQFINYIYLLHVSALHCHLQGSEIATHHATRHKPIHNILSTAPQLSIYQKALGTLPEEGIVMPKHVGATIHN